MPFGEQTFYELLEIGHRASREEIQLAYNRSRAAFSQNSLAVYSLFSPEECQALQRRIEEAYRTLMNEEARRRYDESIGLSPEPLPARSPSGGPGGVRPALRAVPRSGERPLGAPLDPASRGGAGDASPLRSEPEPAGGEGPITGAFLRRVRESRGVSLRDIAATTKVGLTYLQFIEEENFKQLPVPAYLRGFLKAYARCIGLDPDRVASEYLKLYTLYHEIKRES